MIHESGQWPRRAAGYAAGCAAAVAGWVGVVAFPLWHWELAGVRAYLLVGDRVRPTAGMALLFLAIATGCLALDRLEGRRLRNWLVRPAAVLAAILGLATLASYGFGWDLPLAEWPVASAVLPARPGPVRMAVDTALCVCLLAGAAWALTRPPRSGRSLLVAGVLGGMAACIGLVALVGRGLLERDYLGYGDLGVMAGAAAVAIIGLGLGMVALAWRASWSLNPTEMTAAGRKVWWLWPLIGGALAALVGIAAALAYGNLRQHRRAEMLHHLTALAELKAQEIAQWQQERMLAANIIRRTPYAVRRAWEVLRAPGSEAAQTQLAGWAAPHFAGGTFSRILLVDDRARVLFVHPTNAARQVCEGLKKGLEATSRSFRVELTELHSEEASVSPHVGLVIPVVLQTNASQTPAPAVGLESAPGRWVAGALVFETSPTLALFRRLSQLPMEGRSAEVCLFRVEGDDLVCLNELKLLTNAALRLRIKHQSAPHLADLIASGKQGGTVSEPDYRGVPVLAAVRKIKFQDSEWWIVAKVDQAEVDAPMRRQVGLIGMLAGSLLVIPGLGATLFWRQRKLSYSRRELELERRSHDADRRFRVLFDQAAAGVAQVDSTNGRYINLNQRYAALLGRTLPDLLPLGESAAIHPDDQAVFAEPMRQLRNGEIREFTVEHRCQRPDGETIWVSQTVAPLWAPGEAPSQHVAVMLDITERRQMAAALAQEQELLRALLDYLPVAVFVKDTERRFLAANPACAELMGTDLPQLIGTRDEDHYPAELAVAFRQQDHDVLAGQPVLKAEETRRTAEGREETLLISKVPLRNADGSIRGLVGLVVNITERKQAEAALQNSENKFRGLIEHAPDGIVAMSVATLPPRFVYASPSALRIFRYTSEELAQVNPDAATHPEDLPKVQATIRNVLAEPGRSETQQYRFRRADGQWRWVESVFTNLIGSPGVGALVVNFRDITERVETDAALRQREASLREAQRIARLGSWELELAAGRLHWSEETCRIFEITPQEFNGSRDFFLSRVHPDDRASVRATLEQAIAHHQPYVLTHRIQFPDGRIKHLHEQAEPQYDQSGRPSGVIGTVQDVTPLVEADEALRANEAKFRTLVENIPQRIFLKDLQGRLVTFNENFARDVGMPPADLVGKSDADLFPPDLAAKYRGDDLRIMQTGRTEDIEERYWRAGEECWVHTVKTPVRNERGEVTGVFGIFWDITERKRAQARVAEHLAELERWHGVMMGREGRILELKHEVNELLAATGRPPRYESAVPRVPGTESSAEPPPAT